MSLGRRESIADWLMVAGGLLLLASLFLSWSHQFSHNVIAEYGSGSALIGVPRDPDGWQVYSSADVLLAVLAGGLAVAALRGGRRGRLTLLAGLAVAAAFTLHALAVPPTNGANLFDPSLHPPAYTPNVPGAGPGETLALLAIALGIGGVLLSFTADY